MTRVQKKLGLKKPKNYKPNIAICLKIKFIHKDIKVLPFLRQITQKKTSFEVRDMLKKMNFAASQLNQLRRYGCSLVFIKFFLKKSQIETGVVLIS